MSEYVVADIASLEGVTMAVCGIKCTNLTTYTIKIFSEHILQCKTANTSLFPPKNL